MKLVGSSMAAYGVAVTLGALGAPVAIAQTTTRTPAELACELGGTCVSTGAVAATDRDADADSPLRPVKTGTRPICMFNACKSVAPRAAPAPVGFVRRTPARTPSAMGRNPRLATSTTSLTTAGTAVPRHRADMQLQFASASAELSDAVKGEARKFAQTLTDPTLGMADAHMIVEGHTSSIGSPAANQDLSQRRAQAVVNYMVSLGVAPDRLKAVGYGSSRPLPDHAGADAANRRVEIAKY